MIKIDFKKSEIIISIILCILGLVFFGYLLFIGKYVPKAILLFLIFIILHILIFVRVKQLMMAKNGVSAIILDHEGITNHTNLQKIFIPWNEIIDFRSGYYRTNSIYINTKNPSFYKKVKIKNYLTLMRFVEGLMTDKPDLLWIDNDMLAIKKNELLNLLNSELKNKTDQN